MVDANNNAPEPAPLPTTGGIIGTGVIVAERFSRWQPQQVINVGFLAGLLAFGILTYVIISMLMESQAGILRNGAEREELMRQHCAKQCDDGRLFHATEREKDRAFYAAEREKDRAFYATHLRGKGGDE